jgi:oxygen-independent coproporphyrinogen-3 oxidase
VAQPAPISTGIYIHIPWCRSICSYCDFDRQAHAFELIPDYVEALVNDIRHQPVVAVHSIFFGGGTPSLLSPAQIDTILTACRSQFRPIPTVEVTLEANPCDLDAGRVASYVAVGVNRFSLGVQSFDDGLLRLLGRRHSAAQAEQAVRQARAGGAANLSFDLMYALPGQSPQHWRNTLERALQLQPDHLSAYLLTIDERVPLGRQVSAGRFSLPEDDQVAEMYGDAQRLLAPAGYEQYEISNWARPGRASRHNLTYWRDEPYLGFGAGAASSFGGRRYKNNPDPAAYIRAVASGQRALVEDELTDLRTAAQDYLALSLRLREGLDLERFASRFGKELIELGGRELSELLQAGILQLKGRRLRIADAHLLISNEIILRLHQALETSCGRYAARSLKRRSSADRAVSELSPSASFRASSARA